MDAVNRVRALAHLESDKLTRSYRTSNGLTNRIIMKLLDIVTITSFNTTFYLGFVLFQKEIEECYAWTLELLFILQIRVNRELAGQSLKYFSNIKKYLP